MEEKAQVTVHNGAASSKKTKKCNDKSNQDLLIREERRKKRNEIKKLMSDLRKNLKSYKAKHCKLKDLRVAAWRKAATTECLDLADDFLMSERESVFGMSKKLAQFLKKTRPDPKGTK